MRPGRSSLCDLHRDYGSWRQQGKVCASACHLLACPPALRLPDLILQLCQAILGAGPAFLGIMQEFFLVALISMLGILYQAWSRITLPLAASFVLCGCV